MKSPILRVALPLLIIVAVATLASAQAPANDLCADAIGPLAVASVTAGTTTSATTDTGFPRCNGTNVNAPGVWYTVVGTGNTMTASTCPDSGGSSTYNSKVSVYCLDCLTPRCVTGNNDDCPGGNGNESTAAWCSEAGILYNILVHGGGGESGDFQLAILDDATPCTVAPPAVSCIVPANDTCADAVPVTVPSVTAGSTTGASPDNTMPGCPTVPNAPGVWYSVMGTGNTMTASTCPDNGGSATYNTAISVYCPNCATPMCVGGNNDACATGSGLESTVTWCSAVGTEYFILVYGTGAGGPPPSGDFNLAVTDDGTVCPIPADCVPRPPNDQCANAGPPRAVPSVTTGTTIDATIDDTFPACGGATIDSPGVWYTVTGTGNTMTASTCPDNGGSADFDTKISVFCLGCAAAMCVDGNDNTACPGGSGSESTVIWCSQAGVAYRILVHGAGGATGNFNLSLSDDGAPCTGGVNCLPPANDQCFGAEGPLAVPSTTTGNTATASVDDRTPVCGPPIDSPGVWYTVTGTGNTMTASTCVDSGGSASYDSAISVYCMSCFALTCIDGNNDACAGGTGTESTVTWCSQAGVDYHILVHGTGGAAGAFTLSITDDGTPCTGGVDCSVPANDACDAAQGPLAVPSTTPGKTINAFFDFGTPACGPPIDSPGVWYTVLGTGNTMTVSTCADAGGSADYDTKISVYCMTCAALTCIGGDDNTCAGGAGTESTVTWCSEAGVEYHILVHGTGGTTGNFDLSITDDATPCTGGPSCLPPPNDHCEDAIGPLAVPSVTPGRTTAGDVDNTFPNCGANITSPGVWYTVMGTGNTMTASTCPDSGGSADFDTKISVYCLGCASALCVDGNGNDCPGGVGNESTVIWCSQAGVEYHLLVHGTQGGSGTFDLSILDDGTACTGGVDCSRPANDLCADAVGPVAVPSATPGTTVNATIDSSYPTCGTDVDSPGVWYTVAGTGNTMTASTCPTAGGSADYNSKISVYCFDCAIPTCVDGNDDNCAGGAGNESTVTWCSQTGITYFILVHGLRGDTGDFVLSVSDDSTPCGTPVDCTTASLNLRRSGVQVTQCPLTTAPQTPTSKTDLFGAGLQLVASVVLPYTDTGYRQPPPAGPADNSCLLYYQYDSSPSITIIPETPGPATELQIIVYP